jgi:hypothetical protein
MQRAGAIADATGQLVEAALETEQKPIVAVPRRIDRLLINQHRVNHATHLDQLLPIPAVASEARDLARRDGPNLAEADLRHHRLEAGALDPTRSRTAKTVSITSISDQPSEVKRPPMAYCSTLLSRLCRT